MQQTPRVEAADELHRVQPYILKPISKKNFATFYDKIQDHSDFFSPIPSRASPNLREGPAQT